jgi:hypothetical protein
MLRACSSSSGKYPTIWITQHQQGHREDVPEIEISVRIIRSCALLKSLAGGKRLSTPRHRLVGERTRNFFEYSHD